MDVTKQRTNDIRFEQPQDRRVVRCSWMFTVCGWRDSNPHAVKH